MLPKPRHLGVEYAAQFKDASIVEAYHRRPPYPAEVFEILADLVADEPRVVLDVGCGTGDLARMLVDFVDRVDAVDFSGRMIEKGRRLPGGNHPNLNWIHGRVEEATLAPPYAVITAGESLHWMEWDVVLPRLQAALTPRGYLALVERVEGPTPWGAGLGRLIPRFSTNRDYRPYNLVAELELRSLFEKHGEKHTAPVPFTQPVDDYIESMHSRNGFSRDRMPEEKAAEFDQEFKRLLLDACKDGNVELQLAGVVTWGKPMPGIRSQTASLSDIRSQRSDPSTNV